MKTTTGAFWLWASASALALPAKPPAPHIIHIMGDDVGWNDLSYHHGSSSHSPNLDFLATNGVRLVNHHVFKVCGHEAQREAPGV